MLLGGTSELLANLDYFQHKGTIMHGHDGQNTTILSIIHKSSDSVRNRFSVRKIF